MVTYAPIACKHKVSDSISLPSRGSFHLSLTVLYAIGHWVVFSLRGWAPCLPTELHVLGGTHRIPTNFLSHTGLLPSAVKLSRLLLLEKLRMMDTGLVPVRSPLLRESRFLSFPPGT